VVDSYILSAYRIDVGGGISADLGPLVEHIPDTPFPI